MQHPGPCGAALMTVRCIAEDHEVQHPGTCGAALRAVKYSTDKAIRAVRCSTHDREVHR